MARGVPYWVLITPKLALLCNDNAGSTNSTRFNALIISNVKTACARSVTRVFLPIDRSTFQCDSPRTRSRPLRPSALNRTGRKSLKAASGFENKLRPAPPRAGSPLMPTPFEPATFPLTPLPKCIGPIGMAPAEIEPTCCEPPQAEVDSTTVNGRPLFAEYIPATYHPATSLFPRPNGSS